jgi:hypothetical protein
MKKKVSEDQLCMTFANELSSNEVFRNWVLDRCGFSADIDDCRLLLQEQLDQRTSPNAPWWRHWFTEACRCDGCSGKETDIFAVFERSKWQDRFALHIECKLTNGSFTPNQAPGYRLRAQCWAGKARFLYYKDYATILLAPSEFVAKEPSGSQCFDYHLTHIEVAEKLPEFANLMNIN